MATSYDVYCDSDWASCPVTRRSTSGIILKLDTNALATWSNMQATVVLSGGEAEFVATHQGVIEALGARFLLREVLRKDFPIIVHTDSTAGIAVSARAGPGRMKRIDLKLLVLQGLTNLRLIQVRKIKTDHNPAAILTKAVDQSTLQRLLNRAGVQDTNTTSSTEAVERIGAVPRVIHKISLVVTVLLSSVGQTKASETKVQDHDSVWLDRLYIGVVIVGILLIYETAKFILVLGRIILQPWLLPLPRTPTLPTPVRPTQVCKATSTTLDSSTALAMPVRATVSTAAASLLPSERPWTTSGGASGAAAAQHVNDEVGASARPVSQRDPKRASAAAAPPVWAQDSVFKFEQSDDSDEGKEVAKSSPLKVGDEKLGSGSLTGSSMLDDCKEMVIVFKCGVVYHHRRCKYTINRTNLPMVRRSIAVAFYPMCEECRKLDKLD